MAKLYPQDSGALRSKIKALHRMLELTAWIGLMTDKLTLLLASFCELKLTSQGKSLSLLLLQGKLKEANADSLLFLSVPQRLGILAKTRSGLANRCKK